MPTTIGEVEAQVAPPAPRDAPPAKPAPKAPPDRQALARTLRAEAERRARLHSD